MSELTVKGRIKAILEPTSGKSKAGKDWMKINYILANDDGYKGEEQIFCFEIFGEEKVKNFQKYNSEGDQVLVHFNIRTNEWDGKYFVSLQSWKVEKDEKIKEEPKKVESGDIPF